MLMVGYSSAEGMRAVRKSGVDFVELHFLDLPGNLQHIAIPAYEMSPSSFQKGVAKLDGSSIRGFKDINESDMVMVPDPKTFMLLPWGKYPAGRFIVDCYDGAGLGGKRFSRDPRYVAQKAEAHAKDLGYQTLWGPELEFFVFDGAEYWPHPQAPELPMGGAGARILSREAPWQGHNGSYAPRKGSYYPDTPDTLSDIRAEICKILQDRAGIKVDAHHHEVAAAQCEINMRRDSLVKMGDMVTTYKMVVTHVAKENGKLATFMPKPFFGDNGSGMHVHQSLWKGNPEKGGRNVMADPRDKYAELSQEARYYIGGLMEHSRALCAITNPNPNSYRRLVPGYEAPIFIAWSRGNRSANIRIPRYEKGNPAAVRVEFRTPDPSCNIYFAEAAMLMAGLDGIKKKTEPGPPVDRDIYHLTKDERKALGIRELPGSLRESLEELERNHDFLLQGGVFTKDLVETWVALKMEEHVQAAIRPSPFEVWRYLEQA